MPSCPSRVGDRRLALLVGAGVLLALLATAPSVFVRSSDGSTMLATAESLVLRGELAIDDRYLTDVLPLKPSAKRGPDGRAYGKYGIGWSLVLAGVLAAAVAVGLSPGSPAVQWALMGLNPLLSAACAALVYAMARELGAGRKAAVLTAVGGSLSTFAWTAATFDHADPLLTALVTGAFWRTLRYARTLDAWEPAAIGGLLGAALLTKSAAAVLVPGFLLALAAAAWQARTVEDAPRPMRWGVALARPVLLCAACVATGLALQLWLNHVRWGSPFASGYNEPVLTGDLGVGLWHLTVGINRGLLWHAPIAVVGLAAAVATWHRRTPWSLAVILGTAGLLVLTARFYEFGGSWAWGPRYLLPVVPALAASAALTVHAARGRLLVWAAVLVGFLFTLPGVLVDPSAARTTFQTAYLPEAAGTVRSGDTLRPGVIVEQPRSADDVLPEFSGIAVNLWLLQVLAEPCDCGTDTWWCVCADRREMYWNARFRNPPWRGRYPQVDAHPPYGQHILAPALLRACYKRVVFDAAAAGPPADGPRP